MTTLRKLHQLTTFPADPKHGDIWLKDDTLQAYVYNQDSWAEIAYDTPSTNKKTISWEWNNNTVVISNNDWWAQNKFEIFDWLVEHDIKWNWKSVDELELKELTDEFKTLFTLRWK